MISAQGSGATSWVACMRHFQAGIEKARCFLRLEPSELSGWAGMHRRMVPEGYTAGGREIGVNEQPTRFFPSKAGWE